MLTQLLADAGVKGLSDLELQDFPDTGRGVKTKIPLKQNDEILKVPGELLWTTDLALADPHLHPILDSLNPPLSVEDTLAVFLLFVKSRKEGYDLRRSHVDSLPHTYTSTVFFEDDELEVCKGSSLHAVTTQLKLQIRQDYIHLVKRVFTGHPDLFPLEQFSLNEYIWALCTIWSRGMDFRIQNKQFRCIAPFADMFNHSLSSKTCHAFDPHSNSLRVLADKNYESGDQVFIYYGSVPNARLLRLYGFVIPSNPYDAYDLVLTTHPLAPLYGTKISLLAAVDLAPNSTFSLTLADPLPLAVLRYLRIQRATAAELALLAAAPVARDHISSRNEAEVLGALADAFADILAGFRVSLEEIEQGLEQGRWPVGGNTWAAAHVSLGEQRVLRTAARKVQELMALVVCAGCGKVDEENKRCGRCGKVVYCGVECQRNDFKAHKVACRAASIV